MATVDAELSKEYFMSRPNHITGTSGQYNDEFNDEAHQKTGIPGTRRIQRHVAWNSVPIVHNLPGSVDDEFFDDHGIVTRVDLSMVRNASANSLKALVSKENDSEVEVTADNCIRPLECVAQQYAWGKVGSDALVARMKAAQNPNFKIDESSTYAELWVGTHPNGMSTITLPLAGADFMDDEDFRSVPLLEYVQSNPQMHLGVDGKTDPSEEYDLTFLFKVLSIHKVLSIQAHPDKRLAAQLYVDKPHTYKDPNHKPEMAVALSDDFEAMSGFRPISEIVQNLQEYPEFKNLIGLGPTHDMLEVGKLQFRQHREVLKSLFRSYMEANDALLQKQLSLLIGRLSAKKSPTDLDRLILKLSDQFPGDSGIFAPIIFNYLKLKTGDAFYIGANEPHAYIQGEILECMACSDNVVRAGLTPKLKDVETLVKMLTYKCTSPEITRGQKLDANTLLYVPPVDDFAIEIIEISAGSRYVLKDVRSPSVILTLNGSGILQQGSVQSLPISFGKTAFMSANTTATVIANENGPDLKVVRALSNVHL